MNKLSWCLKQEKGIKMVDPNDEISAEYLKESKEDFESMGKSNKKWGIIQAYYCCYNSVYAIIIKCGLKCEIHDCSLKMMEM